MELNTRHVVMQRTDSLCTDEINQQFVVDVSDVVQTTEAELLVMKVLEIMDNCNLNLEQQIRMTDRLVDKAQILLLRAGYSYAWGDDRYVITKGEAK